MQKQTQKKKKINIKKKKTKKIQKKKNNPELCNECNNYLTNINGEMICEKCGIINYYR